MVAHTVMKWPKGKKKIRVSRSSRTSIHSRQWKSSIFSLSLSLSLSVELNAMRNEVEILSSFLVLFDSSSSTNEENRSQRTRYFLPFSFLSLFFFKYAVSERSWTKTAGNWFRLMYISLFVLACSQNMNFFPLSVTLPALYPRMYPLNATTKKQISCFWLKRSRIQISALYRINCNFVRRWGTVAVSGILNAAYEIGVFAF